MLSSMVTPVYQGYLSEFFRGIKEDDYQPMPREISRNMIKPGVKIILPPTADNKPGF